MSVIVIENIADQEEPEFLFLVVIDTFFFALSLIFTVLSAFLVGSKCEK